MQFYIVPALLILFGATRIRDASASANANAKQQVLLDDNSSDSIVGNIPGWTSTATSSNSNSNNNNYRRHLLPDGADDTHFMECVLYLKVVDYEDGHDEKSWCCEFTHEQAATFGGVEMMDIEGLTLEAIEAKGAISGETIFRVKTAHVEQFFTSNDGSSNSETVLRIPQDSDFEIQLLDSDSDPRHAHNRRARRQRHRNLADSKPGTLKALVVRVKDNTGSTLNADALQLQDDFFTDAVCLKTQYAACSHDQLIIEQATEFGTNVNGVQVNGIVDVTIGATASSSTSTELENLAIAKATTEYGGDSSLSETFDLVIFCQPPGSVDSYGSGTWVAYAYHNDWRSYYNDYWCQYVSVQVHEIGHNFNLGHSGVFGGVPGYYIPEYADKSGTMGVSNNSDDTPKHCFTPAKSFQLGWYEQQIKSIDPLKYVSNPQTFILNGIADYEKDGSNGDALVALRLENKGLDLGVDYYIGYNRAIGANIETGAVPNTVTVQQKENTMDTYYDGGLLGRDGFGQSWRLAAMESGDKYRIENYGGSIFDVILMVNSINGKEASITISTSEPFPTATPSGAPTNQPTTNPGPCTNSNGIVKINEKSTTCDKLKNKKTKKKKKLCKKNAVLKFCPGVCNKKCTCKDSKRFKLNGKKKIYKCKNVGKDGQPECSGTVNNKNNILVEDVCPKKCDICFK